MTSLYCMYICADCSLCPLFVCANYREQPASMCRLLKDKIHNFAWKDISLDANVKELNTSVIYFWKFPLVIFRHISVLIILSKHLSHC